jgi:hypothetical protein
MKHKVFQSTSRQPPNKQFERTVVRRRVRAGHVVARPLNCGVRRQSGVVAEVRTEGSF